MPTEPRSHFPPVAEVRRSAHGAPPPEETRAGTSPADTAPYRIHRYPTHWIRHWKLPGGRTATLRPVLPQDDLLEQDFVASLSPSSRRKRFHAGTNGLSAARAAALTRVDYRGQVGFVVTLPERPHAAEPGERVIADAHYVLSEDGESADFALAVSDTWQGRGIGRRLLAALARAADDAGARWLCGEVLAGNHEMLALVERCGFHVRPHPTDDDLVCIERNVEQPLAEEGDSLFGALVEALPRWMKSRPEAQPA